MYNKKAKEENMKAQQVLASIVLGSMFFNQGILIATASTANLPETTNFEQPALGETEVTSEGLEGTPEVVVQDGEVFETKAPESVGQVEKSEIVESLEAIDGLLEQSDTVTSTQDQDTAAKVEANGTTVEIPRDVTEPVTIASEGLEMEITLPKVENASEGTEVATGVVAYASESNFSNAVQANEDGSVRMTTIIDNPNAPTEYEYQVDLPEGGRLELTEEGGVIVYNQLDEPVSMVNTPWAKDAEGKDVATHFEIRDNILIQVVKHDVEGVVYPVTADPWWKKVVNFIGGCIGWHEISSNGLSWVITKGGRRYVTTKVFSRFVPYVGWVACGVGGFAAI